MTPTLTPEELAGGLVLKEQPTANVARPWLNSFQKWLLDHAEALLAMAARCQEAERKLQDASRFCSGEWPCEASTTAASLEREVHEAEAERDRLAAELAACRHLANECLNTENATLRAALVAASPDDQHLLPMLRVWGEENQRRKIALREAEARAETLRAQLHGMQDGALLRDTQARCERLGAEVAGGQEALRALAESDATIIRVLNEEAAHLRAVEQAMSKLLRDPLFLVAPAFEPACWRLRKALEALDAWRATQPERAP